MGDIIFQLFVFLMPILFISLILIYFVNSKKKKNQLDKIEAKLDKLNELIKSK
jgi:cbb3-type cytochrome oxidase subunit 3